MTSNNILLIVLLRTLAKSYVILLVLVVCILFQGRIVRADFVVAESTFDTDLDGWTSNNLGETSWQSAGGNPDGYLRFTDLTADLANGFATAPSKFLGDWSSLDGLGRVEWDESLIDTGENVDSFGAPTLIISGPGGRAVWIGTAPTGSTTWEAFSVPISESSWEVDSGGNWNALLSSVTEFRIQLEHVLQSPGATGMKDILGLDNVRLIQVPEPHSGLLILACVAGILACRSILDG
ncbi:hypothetical protein [Bythopirellula goksoeyrii]|uniref:PEP-CTERM protein-sorting domain-containing protein n=1 Tax=Bythopirellula goksoeyrii TaxID=1400387 RepID=A0A5B9Q6Y3_9BACT|nr:hypothetical protein [Bythopirellula goksoeyrii]QEG34778.1 hypothetical protein Pr1d_20620 [Bythopirellula goksoeyrii]